MRSAERARERPESEGISVQLVITLDSHDVMTELAVTGHPAIRHDDIVDIVHYGDAGVSRNHWIKWASGEYIVIADGDDYCSENFISALVKQAAQHADIVAFPEDLFPLVRRNTMRIWVGLQTHWKICTRFSVVIFSVHVWRRIGMCSRASPLLLDLSWFAIMEGCTSRSFRLQIFPNLKNGSGIWQEARREDLDALTRASLWRRGIAKLLRRPYLGLTNCTVEQLGIMATEDALSPPVHLQGYWQNEQYFSAFGEAIRHDFTFPIFPEIAMGVAQSITAGNNASAVHVRRGDYAADTKTNAVHGLCSPEYYAAALCHIKDHVPDAQLFIFSDDPAWVRENFDTQGLPATVVDLHGEDEAHHDMHLMILCKHHVIANSSFSWWGAWLAQTGGISIAPKQWFADSAMASVNPCPERWLRL